MSRPIFTIKDNLDEVMQQLTRMNSAIGPFGTMLASRAADFALGEVIDNTPEDTGEAKEGWRKEDIVDGSSVVNPVKHIQFLIEGTGIRRAVGVVNTTWKGMRPDTRLHAIWFGMPFLIESFIEENVHLIWGEALFAA